ncbi:phosphoesterase (plasmid) [Gemmatirosa kalamazoonensis]|uniref:Phosphoesterase n=1 Tax=Gemmatirosa kalamazoonensis TaxID=861299 RepID=W0RRV7_9BACT|nr:bifunctional YncE family protein/alkaline phosphatase family protein [Gemmatirosa kalamazoonensis]AHG93065.1 phosphoesterase [Gemmatirosa kalamazoonensis]
MPRPLPLILCAIALVAACRPSTRESTATVDTGPRRLPTGARLDPAGTVVDVGPMPLGMVPTPEGDRVVLLLGGWRQQGVQVVDRATGAVVQTLDQPAAFVGVAFSPDGGTLYASGGNGDVVYRYRWADRSATLVDSLVLATKAPRANGTRYPAGVAVSPDGRTLYVAENLADSLAVVDVASGRVTQRLATERYPYAVAAAPDGTVYVSAWGGNTVSVFTPDAGGLRDAGRLAVARHPSALLLNARGTRLFVASGSTDRVAVVDTRARRVVATLQDPPPSGPGEGSTPNALALAPDGARLYVAEADANAVAVFDLAAATADVPNATGADRLAGRIPTGWYPCAVLASREALLVASGKGRGTAPNPDGPQPILSREHQGSPANTTLRQIGGTVQIVPLGDAAELARLTARVVAANGWDESRVPSAESRRSYPRIEHVVYVVKENRTYDQVLGDLTQADGDTSLLYFPRSVSPNHHALAERFGIYDRFFVNAEVSPDGHNWSMAAYATDYLEKTVPSNYSGRGRTYDYEGTNRNRVPDDDAAEPASGYLWNLAEKKGIAFRNYGEFVVPDDADRAGPMPSGYKGNKPFLARHTHATFPGFDLTIPDQRRADLWIAELQEFVRQGQMPALEIVRLPNDHTAGARRGSPTPAAYMADNDLALGRMIEALSRTPFWRSTVVFVLEDDAQNGPDHVDSHRSPLLIVSPWARPGVHHRWANTTDVLRTIEEILGLASMSQFDHYGRPLRDVWTDKPDLRPYTVLTPSVPLTERNTAMGPDARASAHLALDFEDQADEDTFNRILWRAAKGQDVPYPGARRLTGLELKRGGY